MTQLIHLSTRCRKNSSMMLKKKVLIINVQMVKSEQHFAVTSAKMVAVFQASLKLVRKEATAQISNKDI